MNNLTEVLDLQYKEGEFMQKSCQTDVYNDENVLRLYQTANNSMIIVNGSKMEDKCPQNSFMAAYGVL